MDNEFSNSLEHDDVIQQFENMRTPKKLQKKVSDQHSEEQSNDHIHTLQQAKPILSPGTHIGGQFIPNLKYQSKQLNDKTKLSKTAFPGIQFRSWNINKGELPVINQNSNEILEQLNKNQIGQESEFQQLLNGKTLIYRRVDNSTINQTGPKKARVYSSIFFDSRDKKFHCGDKCLIDQISKILKNRDVYHIDKERLIFNSCFQGGNLFSVFKSSQNQNFCTYQLFLQNDLNTKGCTQWFYFTVRNRIKGKVKFRIMNFYKPTSLYNSGMKILCYKDSQQNPEHQTQQQKYLLHTKSHHHKHKQIDRAQWKRTGTAIRYYNIPVNETKNIYCLEFIHEFDTIGSITHFSYGYPYNYSIDLLNYLNRLQWEYGPKKIFKKDILCTSCMGNNVYILSISDNFKRDRKPIIYIIARQHPGQTPASYIVEGLINFLLSSRPQAIQLRETFLIKIVPMVNVDGVINGNYRSNCSGNDVNRQWDFPSQRIHPQIYHLKRQILSKKKQVVFFLDIHAHSRKMNSFFYGNKAPNNDNKLYPFICSKLNRMIDYDSCTFNDDPSKKTTARVILQNQLNLRNSLTFQCSFYGWEDEKGLKYHYKTKDFIQIGESLAMGFYYSEIGIRKTIQEKQKNISMQKQRKKSLSCKLPSEKDKIGKVQTQKNVNLMNIMKNIDKYCQKLYQKWKKLEEMERQSMEKEDAYSEGSSIDPQHFQLKVQEEDFIQKQSKNQLFDHQNPQLSNNIIDKNKMNGFRISAFHGGYRSDIDKSIQRVQYNSLVSKKKDNQYQQFDASEMKDNSNHRWGWKGNRQAMFIYPTHSNLKNNIMVKQLQSELQMNKKKNEKNTLNMNRLQQYRKSKYGTIEEQQVNNYRYNIIEMKKALKYFLENKSTDYQQYRNPFRSSSNDTTLNLNEKTTLSRSIYHKKRY